MGTLGKVLIVFNILAAGAFVALATMSWGKRQPWAYAVLRYELVVAGLPVDSPGAADPADPEVVPFGFQYGDSPEVATISDKALKEIFAAAQGGKLLGGKEVANQAAELKRARAAVEKALQVDDPTDPESPKLTPEQKRERLKKFLLNQARSGEDRDRYAGWLAPVEDLARQFPAIARDPKELDKKFTANLAAAQDELMRLFDAAAVPVAKQTIDRLETIAKAIEAAATPEEKRRLIHAALGGHAKTPVDRKLVMDNAPPELEEGQREFDKILSQAKSVAGESGDRQESRIKRREIAHLLYHLDTAPEWQQRVYTVVGLQTYVNVIEAQAAEFYAMANRARFAMSEDQARFEPAYQYLVQRTMFLQVELEKLNADLVGEKTLLAGHEVIRNARAEEKRLLENDEADAKANAKKTLASQAEAERALFDVHVQLKKSLDTIIQLEEKLRKVELLSASSNGR